MTGLTLVRVRRSTRLALLLAAFGGLLAASAVAQTHNFVLRDGTKIPLFRSDREIGVFLRPGASVAETRTRLQGTVQGVLRDLDLAPAAPMKIVEVPDISTTRWHALAADPAVNDVYAVYRFMGEPTPVFSGGTVVAKLRGTGSPAQRQALWARYGLVEVEQMRRLHSVFILRPLVADADEVAIAEQLSSDPAALWANPDFRQVRVAAQTAPADPFFKWQWHLENTGQKLLFGEVATAGADIEAQGAWEIATGQGVLFGTMDDSCDVDHEDLRANYIGIGQDLTVAEGEPGANDPRPKQFDDRHGTSVMGLAVAAGNEVGVRGVSFASRFTASRAAGSFSVTHADIARAYTFAMDQKVDVHINSWGFGGFFGAPANPPIIVDAIETAFKEGRDLDGPGGEEPRGMVIVFSAGNEGRELQSGFGMGTIPAVIGVGASDPSDILASFSSFGRDVEFVAPGVAIATTDNEDGPDKADEGYNVGGFAFGGLDIDPKGSYTGDFGGTSAACPIAAGVAGLILSVNTQLTATDVRIVMEHTCDKVSEIDARYNAISDKSLLYGHGRINARRAVEAAQESLTNGGHTWPDVAQNVSVEGTTIRWARGENTTEFLVVERVADFGFMPVDGACYDVRQAGCETGTTALLPDNVNVLFVGCGSDCLKDSAQSVNFELPSGGRKFFAIYARNAIGRYSFGSPIDWEGKTTGGTGTLPLAAPRPTIGANPFPPSGKAPLTIDFNGNAVSDQSLDNSQTTWDFDVGAGESVDAAGASVSHTYDVPGVFTARLTMVDVTGVKGFAEIRINVDDPNPPDSGGTTPAGDIRIVVGLPGTPGASTNEGVSPFAVELRLEADTPSNVQSISWDLGDGTTATGLAVPHTYTNQGDSQLVFLVTANVTSTSTGGKTVTASTQEFITVFPGQVSTNTGEPNLPGTGATGSGGTATPCGVIGMVPFLFMFGSLVWLRRRSD